MAADRAQLNYAGAAVNVRVRDIATKIFWYNTARVAACFSGDIAAQNIAENIVAAIRSGTFDPSQYQ